MSTTTNTTVFAIGPPNLPTAPDQFQRQYQDQLNNVLRLFFSQVATSVNQLLLTSVAQQLSGAASYANDAAAAAGGVAIGGFYRNGSVVQIRVT